MYGRAEAVSGDLSCLTEPAAAHVRIATRCLDTGKDAGLQQIENSMRLLKVSKLDLVQVRNLLDLPTQLENLRALKTARQSALYRHHALHGCGRMRIWRI